MTGRRWPDPTEPGVPAAALADSFHWLAWPDTGAPTIGQWSPDLWRWVVTFWGEMVTPENMAHLDYLGVANPPSHTLFFRARGATSQIRAKDLSADVSSYMTTKKPVTLAASPQAVFNILDHAESTQCLIERIEQFCQLIPEPEIAAMWRQDLLMLLHHRHGTQRESND